MTTQTEALKLALEAFETLTQYNIVRANIFRRFEPTCTGDYVDLREFREKAKPAITAIKEALAQQEGQSNYCLQCEALSRELAALKAQQSNEQSKCNHTKTITRADIDGNQIETTCGECGERVAQQSNEQVEPARSEAYDMVDRFLRNSMHDEGYADYSKALDLIYTHPPVPTAQPKEPKQEPVAIIHRNEYNEYRLEPHDNFDIKSIPFNVDVSLFKSPQRTWVGLTIQEANELWESTDSDWELMKRTEAKLKEKNT